MTRRETPSSLAPVAPGFNRRQALLVSAGAWAAAGHAFAQPSAAGSKIPASARARLGATTVCFRSRFPYWLPGQARTGGVSLLQAPAYIRDNLGLTNFEVWNLQFESDEPDYCARLRNAATAAGGRIINIQLDGTYDLSHPDPGERAKSVDFVKGWMQRAQSLGAPTLRANPGPNVAKGPFEVGRAVESYRQLAEFGRSIGVKILVENHTGHSIVVDNVVTLLKAVDHPWCRAIADWGNSVADSPAQRLADVEKLFPWLELVSAKGLHFGADGRHLEYDIGTFTRATEASGYRGLYSIELFTLANPPPDPVAAANDMVLEIAPHLKRLA